VANDGENEEGEEISKMVKKYDNSQKLEGEAGGWPIGRLKAL
jgi:hypothetical protein